MKYILILIALFFCACNSTPKFQSQEEMDAYYQKKLNDDMLEASKTGKPITLVPTPIYAPNGEKVVEVKAHTLDKNGNIKRIYKTEHTTESELKKDNNKYKDYTITELSHELERISDINNIDEILTEVFSRYRSKDKQKVEQFVKRFANDTRTLDDPFKQKYWYENKNQAEKLELRIYILSRFQGISMLSPKGLDIRYRTNNNLYFAQIKKVNFNTGKDELIAVRKDDVVKIWLNYLSQ